MSGDAAGAIEPRHRLLTRQRVFAYGTALALIYAGVLGGAFWLRLWFVDAAGHPIAVDFLAFWSAGFLTAAHGAASIYDTALYHAAEAQALGRTFAGQFPWAYPPLFLLLVTPLSALPYLTAWLLWVMATASFCVFGLARIVPWRLAVPLGLAGPAALWCASVGQNGFLTAGLIGCALGWLERRPLLAGVCLGFLTYKPQFGLLFPLFLIVTRHGRVCAAAAATAVLMAVLSTAVFGIGAWRAFAASLSTTGTLLMGGGAAWFKLQSPYALIYLVTGDARLAMRGHVVLAALVVVLLLWLWARRTPMAVKAAGLVAGAFLVTPYAYVYDSVLLAVAVALLVQDGVARGFRRLDVPLLCAAWLSPGLFGLLGSLSAPLGCVLILVVACRRAGPVTAQRSR